MSTDSVQAIGQAIAEGRMRLGLTQDECARRIGVSRQTWMRVNYPVQTLRFLGRASVRGLELFTKLYPMWDYVMVCSFTGGPVA